MLFSTDRKRSALKMRTPMAGWNDGSGYGKSTFVTTWDTTQAGSANDTIILPLYGSGVYDFVVDWGDGNTDHITADTDPATTHVYTSSGTYTVTFKGILNGFRFNNLGDKSKLMNIARWGNMNPGNFGTSFYGCDNLTISATDGPDLTGVTTLSQIFRDCTSLTTENFNGWDLCAVTSIASMFRGATSFNGYIDKWNLCSCTSLNATLRDTAFNRDISGWDVSSVETFNSCFYGCSAFNKPLNAWNTASLDRCSFAFYNCSNFNQPLGSWQMDLVTTIEAMFFGCSNFDQDLSGWNTASLANADNAFKNTTIDRDFSGWDVSQLTTATNMFDGVTLSTANYDALLIGWEAQTLQSGTDFSAGSSTYTGGGAAATARADLLAAPNLWTIADGGIAP